MSAGTVTLTLTSAQAENIRIALINRIGQVADLYKVSDSLIDRLNLQRTANETTAVLSIVCGALV